MQEFRKIPSLFNLYEVNLDGTVFRNVKTKKPLKITLDMHHSKKGYFAVYVSIKKKVHHVMIHKVVAECWLGEKPENHEIDHIDRNPHNNDYRNLRYVTHSKQMKNRVLSDRILLQAKQNCLKHSMELAKQVTIRSDLEEKKFLSHLQAAVYLANRYNKKVETVRKHFKQRKSKIFDYEIIYS